MLPGMSIIAPQQYDPAAVTLFAAMTTQPTAARKKVINDLIVGLKVKGIWQKLDIFYVTAAHNSQAARLNWVNPSSYNLSLNNSPTFTADRGYAGASSDYLKTGWNPSTNAINLSLNDNHLMAWDRSSSSSSLSGLMGCYVTNPSTTEFDIYPNYDSDLYIRCANGGVAVGPAIGTPGMLMGNRSSSSSYGAWYNGSLYATVNIASNFIPTAEIYLLAINTNNDPAFTTGITDQLAASSMGAGLSGKETDYYNLLQAYMTAVGA